MTVDIRCRLHLHHRMDVAGLVVRIKCDQCSNKRRRPVFHHYTVAQVIDAAHQGSNVLWIDRQGNTSTN